MNAYKQIRKELKSLGIDKAIVGDATVDGSPAVQLMWNGKVEYVTTTHLVFGKDEVEDEVDLQYQEWLAKRYADKNIK